MILKKFIGKTLDAARKSARQMYGEDVLVLESSGSDGKEEAGITVAVKDEARKRQKNEHQAASHAKTAFKPRNLQNGGVRFEPSGRQPGDRSQPGSPGLLALRKYAQEQARSKSEAEKAVGTVFEAGGSRKKRKAKTTFQPGSERGGTEKEMKKDTENMAAVGSKAEKKTGFTPRKAAAAKNGKLYSRSSARRKQAASAEDKRSFKPSPGIEADDRVTFPMPQGSTAARAGNETSGRATISAMDFTALNERMDRLEALIMAGQDSRNFNYVTHPAFRQLLQTGMEASTVMAWFSSIVNRGIDPRDNSDLFMARLSSIVRKAVGRKPETGIRKYVLFTGLSGSGKTSLITKLSRHPELMKNKNVAVAAVYPLGEAADSYYSVLEPFCKDRDIPFFPVRRNADVSNYLEEWQHFDHVLVDTPSLPADAGKATEQFLRIRQLLAPLTPMEVHYVVNAALHRYKRPDGSLRNPVIEADFLAVTHLDEAAHWGPLIPFRQNLGCNARFISQGPGGFDSLELFDPGWFVQKIFQDSQAL